MLKFSSASLLPPCLKTLLISFGIIVSNSPLHINLGFP
uniref:Uncharacterized protein n=1 Tax=viral metagenome TaxID=1070528 RepID=A0A6C0AEH9_9ZZZZ